MFQLVQAPTIFPQHSLTRSTVGPMVDTQVILNKGGRVYVTELEAGEIIRFFPEQIELRATAMGWCSPRHVEMLNARVAELEQELAAAQKGQPVVVSLADAKKLLRV